MITAAEFVESLKRRGVRAFTGVPCSFFREAINHVLADAGLHYTIVPNEGTALALATGAVLAGERAAVLIQNSGLGNLINPLTSLNMIYRLPVLLFISGRAYGVPDEPQHAVIGRTMPQVIAALGLPARDMPAHAPAWEEALDEALAWMERERLPYVFFVRQGTVGACAPAPAAGDPAYPLRRIDAVRILTETLAGDEYIVATTGRPSRELFAVCDRERNFYMQGSMGHAAAIGLGLARSQPDVKVIVLDGDGAVLMHLGVLSSIGHYRPQNFYHLVLDNEAYESTGNQDTTSPTTDLVAIARACGYAAGRNAASAEELRGALRDLLSGPGPALLRVKINRLPTAAVPRITSKYTPPRSPRRFKPI